MPAKRNPPTQNPATEALRAGDPRLRRIIDAVGPCTLAPQRRYFLALCEAIVSQQLAVKAASTIFGRFRALFPRRTPTPPHVLDATDQQLRGVGLSKQKLGYLRDLAAKFADGTIPRRRLTRMRDDEVTAALTRVKGIGPWTAQMFLIFVLNRPDVWPTEDLGIRRAVQINWNLKALPAKEKLTRLAEPWRPHRSQAAWYLWASLDNKPISQ